MRLGHHAIDSVLAAPMTRSIAPLLAPWLVMAALVSAGCASTPELTSIWSNPAVTPSPFRNPVVFGVAAKERVRRAYEDNFVAALQARRVRARPGYSLLTAGGIGDAEAIRKAVSRSGADGVIVTHLVGARAKTVYVPPNSYSSPSLYASLYPYYDRVFSYVSAPGYYAAYPVLQLEASLYDARREKLVWSARSATMDPGSEDTTIAEVIETLTRAMAEAGFLPR
jgi:hypothetical protein